MTRKEIKTVLDQQRRSTMLISSQIIGRRNMPAQQSVVLLKYDNIVKVATLNDQYFEIATIRTNPDGTKTVLSTAGLGFGEFDKLAKLRAEEL